MTATTIPDTITLTELALRLREADPAALLIKKRLLRRVLWQHTPGRTHGFSLFRREFFVLDRKQLLLTIEPDELAPYDSATLPEQVILLGRSNALLIGPQPRAATLLHYWRLLFRARMELALREKIATETLTVADIERRREMIGRAEFDEITTVLTQDHLYLDGDGLAAAWVQFVAQFIELFFFAPQQLYVFFPALSGRNDVEALVTQEVDAETLFKQTQLTGAPAPLAEAAAEEPQPARANTLQPAVSANGQDRRWAIQAERNGNNVRAALLQVRLADATDTGRSWEEAQEQLRHLARRLRAALDQPPAGADEWFQVLRPLLRAAAQGYWPAEAQLLYDLQRVCLDRERELTSVSLLRWLTTLGQQPVRKLVPGQQLVLMLQNLHNAGKSLGATSLPVPERQRLEHALAEATERHEQMVRGYFRPLLLGALTEIGPQPTNLPETVARDKVVEELLDRIVGRGLITMSDLRDALSRNHLKIHDLSGPGEFLLGDRLLQLNRDLAGRLENVYRPGEFYLRWMQSFSSLLFGTPWGRLFSRYVLLPFGGAFIALKFCFFMYQEIGHFLPKLPIDDETANLAIVEQADPRVPAQIVDSANHVRGQIELDDAGLPFLQWFKDERHEASRGQFPWDPLTTPWSLALLGIFIFLMLYVPPFRRVVLYVLAWIGKGLQRALIDLPAWLAALPLVRVVLDNFLVRLAGKFLLKPLIGAALVAFIAYLLRARLATIELAAGIFFVAALLLLATRLGRALDEILSNWLLEAAHNFGYEIIPAVLRAIADGFKRLLSGLERVLYGVDEWFRFRRRESTITRIFKSIIGMFWLVLSYVLRFLVVLIIEPTINPVKHFPMVTVAGKFMLLVAKPLHDALDPLVHPYVAWLVTVAIVGGLPGIAGFLVWELKENWRLYSANRPATLRPVPVGHHGETVAQLLQPGFHSGTVPKSFARWRSAVRRGRGGVGLRAKRQLAHVEEAVRHFVERELLRLLRQVGPLATEPLATGRVQLAVTRIRVEIACSCRPPQPLLLDLEFRSGELVARLHEPAWLEQLDAADQDTVQFALQGLYQYAGVVQAATGLQQTVAPVRPIIWNEWVEYWDRQRASAGAAHGHLAAPVATLPG